ncbi:Autotransporter assembly factor TamB [Thalassovita autumnalis]|uniref:Autotransporter assembly factor TamB n=1 Tax=Thalassovita autumnalis TaxID=2072972 RepID=A0A0P1FT63_9RHOB|nr:translocation/assembly module TamB domain-containing protein [Thalassovita autumnalis]CUH65180.1 Autotransporter assembly factor TamB [Thalassovita autumnalis]CUH71649.1 Autotransporter assembly factor TamB [Thalassovita autumnalis]
MRYVLIPLLAATTLVPLPTSAQEDDRGYLEALLEETLSDAGREIDIIGFEGALSSVASIERLTIADDQGIWITLEEVELDWKRSALLRGRLEVNKLSAKTLDLSRLPDIPSDGPTPEAQGFALPELPVSVDIAELAINRAALGEPVLGQAIELSLSGAMNLADGAGSTSLDIRRQDGITGEIILTANYINGAREAAIDLLLQEDANGLLASKLNLPGTPPVTLRLSGAGPMTNFSASTTLSSDGAERLSGDFSLGLDPVAPERQVFSADLGGDLTPLFAPEYRDFFGTDLSLTANGYALKDVVALENMALTSKALSVQGQVTLQDGWPSLIAVEGQLGHGNGRPVLLPVAGAGTRIGSALFQLTHDEAISPDWTLAASLTDFQSPDLRLPETQLRGSGQIIGTRIEGAVDFSAKGLEVAAADLARALGKDLSGATTFSVGQNEALHLKGLDLRGEDYSLTGDLTLSSQADDGWSILPDVQLAAQDLSRFAGLAAQPLSGAADLAIAGRVSPLAGSFALQFDGGTTDLALAQPLLDPLLKGRADLHLGAARDKTGITLDPLQITAPEMSLTGRASLKSLGSSAELSARLRDLSLLQSGLTGPATAELTAEQLTADNWQVTAALNGPEQASLRTDVTLQRPMGDNPAVTGTAAVQLPDLAPYAQLASLPIPLTGGMSLELTGRGEPLQQVFDISATAKSRDIAIGNSIADALMAGQTTLQLAAEKSATSPILLRQLDLQGQEVTASLSGSGGFDNADVRYTARLRDMALLGAGISGALSAEGRARMEGRDWRINSQLGGPAGAALQTQGTLAQDFSRADLSVTGAVPLSLANPLIQPRSLQGQANLDLRLASPLGLGAVTGQIRTAGAQLALPTLKQALEDISGSVTLSGGRAALDLTARPAAGGDLRLSGPVSLDAAVNADLSLALRNIVLEDPSLYSTSLSGDLAVNGPLLSGGARISGGMELGQTELRIAANSAPRFASLPGLKHRNEPAEVRRVRRWAGLIETERAAVGPAYGLDLTISAPARVFVRGRGLDAELGGSLRVGGTSHQVIPEGQFDLIRGRMDLLGNRLNLTEGLIQLQGAFDPFLRFVAETTTDAVTAEITIEGPASAPVLRFTSTPDLPEDEVLSLLLFGRDLSTISPLQAVRLAAAIATLSGNGGNLTGGLRQGLALDDLDVTTDEDGATQARIGKYISDNIYTEITADTDGNNRIDLNLQLSPSVTARGRLNSDGETGLGLFIERDY